MKQHHAFLLALGILHLILALGITLISGFASGLWALSVYDTIAELSHKGVIDREALANYPGDVVGRDPLDVAAYIVADVPNFAADIVSAASIMLSLTGVILILLVIHAWWHDRRARKRAARGHCPSCDYNLTGNESGSCPECGWYAIGSPD